MPQQDRQVDGAIHLIVACVLTTAAIVAIVVDLSSPHLVIHPAIWSTLLAAPIVGWCVYRSQCAEQRVIRRCERTERAVLAKLAEVQERLDQRLSTDEAAVAYVDGMMARDGEARPLRSVNGSTGR